MVRELCEELGLYEGIDFQLPAEQLAHLEFTAWSDNARAATAYTMELFGGGACKACGEADSRGELRRAAREVLAGMN
jgi:hypothetical protein